jgi:hypothetical protein
MFNTKHDLCANTAKLNLNELQNSLLIARGLARTECERALGEIQMGSDKGRMHGATRLAEAASALEKISISLHYLNEAQTRDEIVIIKD